MEFEVKYVGPRVHISHLGVDFKEGKHDKFLYIPYALEILQSIDKSFSHDKVYIHTPLKKNYSSDEIINIVSKYESNIGNHIQKEIEKYEKHLQLRISEISKLKHLLELEKKVFVSNLKIMQKYQIQRAINKIVYMHIIEAILFVVKRERIKQIQTPFCEKFWHILHTLEGHLLTLKSTFLADFSIDVSGEDKTTGILDFRFNS